MSTHADRDLQTGGLSMGRRVALIAVDLSNGFTSPDSPLGGDFDEVLIANRRLIDAFYASDRPVFFTTVVYSNEAQASVFRQRLPDLNILQKGSHWVEINDRVSPSSKDVIIEKQWPSAFFSTSLAEQLTALEIDTVVVTGLTTSGCVRATVVDALQHNFITFVAEQACGDRNLTAHRANLHDMHAKYAQVTSVDSIITQLSTE